ncbi:MAG: nicotinate (nicotinamide) nucleotide adenylyltransferase [Anaerolineaceae bacterium]|nr:nicotinate (nicotinamide) nucleotide adenylyltransferase [Anaerolineaceae bacterium]
MGRIGIFGGTFDPPHLGHLILAAEATAQLGLDRLLWVLTPDPPHKRNQQLTPVNIRLELVHAALRDDPNFELNRVDLDRDGPHYTLDTVKIIHQQNPMDELFYLIGGDSLHDFPNWYKPNQLLAEVTGLGVMRRPGDQIDLSRLEMALPGVIQKINFVDAPLLEIASHEIRSRIAAGRPYRYYLLPAVYECIKEKGYYLK